MPWRRWARRALLAATDGTSWTAALAGATVLRHEGDLALVDGSGVLTMAVVAMGAQATIGAAAQLYRGRYWVGSLDEAVQLTRVVLLVGAVVFVVNLALPAPALPRSTPVTAALLALVSALAARWLHRRTRERPARVSHESAQRVVVVGAGRSGRQLVQSMLDDPASGYVPVAMLDDDLAKRRLRVCGVGVLGGRADVVAVAAATGASLVVIAMRNADASVLREISAAADGAGVPVQVLPPLSELFRSRIGVADLRELDVTDLLGRRQIDTDIDQIARHFAGKRVLVSGAGGSIGSELCRQLHRFGPAELYMLDHDESGLHGVRLSIYRTALLDSPDVVLADIRDAEAVRDVLDRCRPHVVFHAAALKHLPMLEQYPLEAWKTNVLGTLNMLEASRDIGVETFVNISTDKAANPNSVLGRSKRVGERLTAAEAARPGGAYLSVRFGNVLGSRGSVLATFTDQLARGGPVTVTHPEVTRFFMTIPEAVQLVIQAAAIGRSGETLVLDMGEPVRIADVARQLMRIAGRSAPIVFTGLRQGEKLHEELFGRGELDLRPCHPSISHVAVPPLAATTLTSLARRFGADRAMAMCSEPELDLPVEGAATAPAPRGPLVSGSRDAGTGVRR